MILPSLLLLAGLALLPQAKGRWVEGSYGDPPARLRYRLFLPSAQGGPRPLPLVVMLHGCTQSAEDFAAGTRLAAEAEREGFLLVLPEQRPEAHPQRCWTWYDPAHQRRGAGEPALLAGIAREVAAAHGADPARVYVGGISAGGAMAVNVAAAYPELFAAVGVHSGIAYGAARDVAEALRVMREGPTAPDAAALRAARGEDVPGVPLFLVQGSADPVVSPANAGALAAQWALASGWAADAEDEARLERTREEAGGRVLEREVRRDAGGRVVVEVWRVEGLAHAWSGGSPEGSFTDARGPDATAGMVRFFLDHPRAGAPR